MNRRAFLIGSVSLASLAGTAAETSAEGRVGRPLPPPGCGSAKNLLRHCTGCNLCVARCPSNVLRAAGLEYGLSGVMMPRMDFSLGYCRPDCNACGKVCPAGAIRPFAVAEKKAMRQAVAVYDRAACLVRKEKIACGNCAVHCPYKAIRMEKASDGRSYPTVDAGSCAGCGACEYHCPTKAVRVVVRDGQGVAG